MGELTEGAVAPAEASALVQGGLIFQSGAFSDYSRMYLV